MGVTPCRVRLLYNLLTKSPAPPSRVFSAPADSTLQCLSGLPGLTDLGVSEN